MAITTNSPQFGSLAATRPSDLEPPVLRLSDPALEPVWEKVRCGQRLSLADGELLYSTPDIWGVCAMADAVRRRLHGDAAYYNVNRHFNYTNVCALSCAFCEFYRKAGQEGAYERSIDDARAAARAAVEAGATEMHIVGGLHPTLPFSYYTDMLSAMREEARRATPTTAPHRLPDGAGELGSSPAPTAHAANGTHTSPGTLNLKAFTAVEIVHLARIARVYKGAAAPGGEGRAMRREAIRWVLERLIEAGLGSLPGGGAEVFDDRVHDEAYKGKIRSDVWLDVHSVAHELRLNTNATLLYGHIESRHDRLVHLHMLRRAQDEALTRLGYTGVECEDDSRSPGDARSRNAADDRPGEPRSGHLGFTGTEGAGAPIVTLTRPGVELPETRAFAPPSARMPSGDVPAGPATQRTGYYQTIIPLPFFPDGSDLEHLPGPSGLENLRTLAIARLMLDNFPHVKAFWIMQTLGMAQIMLRAGADDMDGTVVWYDITKVGGSGTHQEVSVSTLKRLAREAGCDPIERDTLYRSVWREGSVWGVHAACP